MPRTVSEWIGKNDDAKPTEACKRRILAKQDGKCVLSGKPFTAQEKPQFDHITPLWMGGENRERNLQAIHGEPHKRKTKAEAAVRAKVNANTSKHLGLVEPKRPIPNRGFPKSQKPKPPSKPMPVRVRDVFGRPIARTT